MQARSLLLIAFLFVLIGCHKADKQKPAAANKRLDQIDNADLSPDLKSIVNGNNRFACDLYGRLRAEKGNVFFSPNSISTALAMTYAGAKAKTEQEMATVLHFDLAQNQLHQAFSAVRDRLNLNDKDMEVRTANRLWGQTGYRLLPAYLQLTKDRYGAELGEVDFIHQTEAARQVINAWIAEQTKDRIKDLVPAGVLNELTRLVLTNAIYFKGKWDTQFKKEATKNLPFHLSVDATINVPMMHQMHAFKYGEIDSIQIIELPYVGNRLSMFVLLPKEVDGQQSLEEKLTHINLDKWTSTLREQEVDVYLPKFTMTSAFSLKDVLQAMGMTAAFNSQNADFSGMDGKKDLYLSAVLHQAFVDVNEEGTKAAAATGVIETVKSDRGFLMTFRADHPFVFLIGDDTTGSILFMGRLVSPPRASE
jgi:serine protease inhibitor